MKKQKRILAILLAFCAVCAYIPVEAADISAIDTVEIVSKETDTSDSICEYETEIWSDEYTELVTETEIGADLGELVNTTSTPITSTTIPDGVYGLQNAGNVGLWMDIQMQKSSPGYHVQQYAQTSSSPPTDTFYRASLFKISKVPGTNQYVIRSMLNNRMSFGFSGNEVITKEIPAIDADVPTADRFTITYSSNGYVIKPVGSSYAVSANDTMASGMAGAPDSYLSKRTTTEAGLRAQWVLYQYTGAARSGTSISYPSSWTSIGITQGSSTLVGVKTWSTVIGANTPYVQVAPGYEHIATYSWDASNFKMTLNANAVGTIRTYTRIKYNEDSETVYAGTSTFTIIPQEGMYYLQNQGTNKYAGIADGNIVSGTAIQQFDFDASNNMQWIIEHVTDSGGYVRIQSFYSALYMSLNTSNLSIVEQSYTNEYNLWKFETMTDGNVKVICKATEASNAVMSVPSSASANGTALTMSTYVDNSDLTDEWILWYSPYMFSIYNYYDEGYSVRFANAYGDAFQRIKNYNNNVAERLLRLFGVAIVSQCNSFESPADVCKELNYGQVTFNNLHETCEHNPKHITPIQLRNTLPDGTQNSSVVIWTGHILLNNPSSDSNKSRFSILITPSQTTTEVAGSNMRNNKSESEIFTQSIYSFAHEISHQLGNPDHYCYRKNESNVCDNPNCDICVYGYVNPRSCLMGDRNTGLLSLPDDNLLCSECQARIQQHLNEHH